MTTKRIFVLIVACLLGWAEWAWCESPQQGDFYVSTDGNDTGPGSLSQPFGTLERAKLAVRDAITAGLTKDIIVYIRGGVYLVNSPIVFNNLDSGNSSYSITYKAYPGEEVRFIGGQQLAPEWFETVTDPCIINRLPAGMAGDVLVADLAVHGITDYGTLLYRGFEIDNQYGAMELFVGDQPMRLARYPNFDPDYPDTGRNPSDPTTGWFEIPGIPGGSNDRTFYYSGTRPERWTTAADPWIWCVSSVGYADSYVAIQNIDTTNKIITLVDDPYHGIEFRSLFTPIWFGFNLLEEMDQPNEWYLDRSSGKLYLYPPGPLAGQGIYVSMLDTMLYFQNARYVNFDGLIMEMTRYWTVNVDALSDHVRFEQCVFRNSCTDSIFIEGANSGLDRCALYDNGDGAVTLRGGNRFPLTMANNYVQNCHIHNLNRWGKSYQPAVITRRNCCGLDVSHNLIHDLGGIAYIYPRNNEITITYNEIYNVCRMVDDNGALYCMWDWAAREHDVKYNFIHHIHSIFNEYRNNGVYMDTGGSGQQIKYNIFYEIEDRAILIGGGRDSVIDNNIFARCNTAIMIDKRLVDPIAGLGTMQGYLINFINGNPDWANYYPGLFNILLDEPQLPKNNHVLRNIAFDYDTPINYGFFIQQNWTANGWWGWWDEDLPANPPIQYLIQQDNLTGDPYSSTSPMGVDPCFVDEANLNMNLDPCSPAYTIPGWQDIPFDQIGLIPLAPTVYLARYDCDYFTVYGSCEPWAQISSAVIQPSNQDISSYLAILDNGSIYGEIPKSVVPAADIMVEITVVDPKNHISPVGTSNMMAARLDGDLNNDCTVDFDDFTLFLSYWLDPCTDPFWCDGADMNQDAIVNQQDCARFVQLFNMTGFGRLASLWLTNCEQSGHAFSADLNNDHVVNLFDLVQLP